MTFYSVRDNLLQGRLWLTLTYYVLRKLNGGLTITVRQKNKAQDNHALRLDKYMQIHGKSIILGTQLANGYAGLPHLALAHPAQFLVQLLTIVRLRVAVDRDLSFLSALY